MELIEKYFSYLKFLAENGEIDESDSNLINNAPKKDLISYLEKWQSEFDSAFFTNLLYAYAENGITGLDSIAKKFLNDPDEFVVLYAVKVLSFSKDPIVPEVLNKLRASKKLPKEWISEAEEIYLR